MRKTYQLTEAHILQIFQAGARRGYSQRSIMAGAKGTDEPDFETFLRQFDHEYENPKCKLPIEGEVFNPNQQESMEKSDQIPQITITQGEYLMLLAKAKKWDALEDTISDYYESYDDDGHEMPPKLNGDLCDIGEEAAIAFGFL